MKPSILTSSAPSNVPASPEKKHSLPLEKANEIKDSLLEIKKLLDRVILGGGAEKKGSLNYREELISKLEKLFEKGYTAEQFFSLSKALRVSFNKLDREKILCEPAVFCENSDDYRQKCKAEFHSQMGLFLLENTESTKKYQLNPELTGLILDIVLLFAYVMNKLNYLQHSYSVVYEWYHVKKLNYFFEQKGVQAKLKIKKNISQMDDVELKRLQQVAEKLKARLLEVKLYEQGFKTKIEEKISIDLTAWKNFLATSIDIKADDTVSKIQNEIKNAQADIKKQIDQSAAQFMEIQEQTQKIESMSNAFHRAPTPTLLGSRSFVVREKSTIGQDAFLESLLDSILKKLPRKRFSIDKGWEDFYLFFSKMIRELNNKCLNFTILLDGYCSEEFSSSTQSDERHKLYEEEYKKIKKKLETNKGELTANENSLKKWQPDEKIQRITAEIETLREEIDTAIYSVNDYLSRSGVSTSSLPPSPSKRVAATTSTASQSSAGSVSSTLSNSSETPILPTVLESARTTSSSVVRTHRRISASFQPASRRESMWLSVFCCCCQTDTTGTNGSINSGTPTKETSANETEADVYHFF